uniref:Uncharacterized protein n=1 Tax=Sphaerodactylus townsendi TaxID=933632 RepID=A0ACB8FI57_9SAUR
MSSNMQRLTSEGPSNLECEETVSVEEPAESISLVTLSKPRLSRSLAFLQLHEQVEEAPLMARRTVSAGRLEVRQEFYDPEDARARDPPDLRELEGATAMPAEGARARDSLDLHELEGATALPAIDLRCPPIPEPDLWTEQLEALERAKRDWGQEREALKREHEALELEREQECEALESERLAFELEREQQR